MTGANVRQCANHRALDVGMLDFELGDEALDALPLEAEIAASRTAAADDRQL
jgi:hypothetical protein